MLGQEASGSAPLAARGDGRKTAVCSRDAFSSLSIRQKLFKARSFSGIFAGVLKWVALKPRTLVPSSTRCRRFPTYPPRNLDAGRSFRPVSRYDRKLLLLRLWGPEGRQHSPSKPGKRLGAWVPN